MSRSHPRRPTLAILAAAAASILAACTSALTPSYATAPARPGPDGVPVFEGRDFRHPANEPFFCFAHVSPKGEAVTRCREIQEWCAQSLREVEANGLTVLSGCKAADEVTCLTFYRSDATKTSCYGAPADCEVAYAAYMEPEYGATREQLTACTTIDRSFQPAS